MKLRGIAGVLVLLAAPAAGGATLEVPGTYATIQAAVAAANPGDVIEISKGTYFEHVTVSKSDLVIKGLGGDKVVIDAGGSGLPLQLSGCTNVLVQNIQVRNSADNTGIVVGLSVDVRIVGCTVSGVASTGISVGLASECQVKNCHVTSTGGEGILVAGTVNCLIYDNTVEDTGGDGIRFIGSLATIERNRVTGAGGDCIHLGEGANSCTNSLVVENETSGGVHGINLGVSSTDNSILDNVVAASSDDGIQLLAGADRNVLQGNVVNKAGGDGIETAGVDCFLVKNKVKKSTFDGIDVFPASANCYFYKNQVKKAGACGFLVDGTPSMYVRNKAAQSGQFDLKDYTNPGENGFINNKFATVAP